MKMLKTITLKLAGFNHIISMVGLWIASALIGGMAVLVVTQVFFRYVLNNSLSWAEDLSLMLLVYSAFLIIPYAYRWSLHVGIDLIVNMLPARVGFALYFLSGLAVITLAIYFIEVSWAFTIRSSIMANAVPIKMKYVYAIMPVMFTFLIPSALELQFRSLIGLIEPDDPEARLTQHISEN